MSAPSKARTGASRSGLTRIDLVVLVAVALVLSPLLAPTVARARRRSHEERSRDNLNQIGLQSISYLSDQGHKLPHLGPYRSLDGGVESDTAARCLRAYVHFGYITDPSVFVNPASADVPASSARGPSFSWEPGERESGTDSPIARAGRWDAPLTRLGTLSYAWTRRGLCSASVSTSVLAGDKARRLEGEGSPGHEGPLVGNHPDCFQVVCHDGHTERIPPFGGRFSTRRVPLAGEPPSLFGTATAEDGFLGGLADDD